MNSRHNKGDLPIVVTATERANLYIMSGLAQEAFRLANYDMTPEDSINAAIRSGLIVVEELEPPRKIRRMPDKGSFC